MVGRNTEAVAGDMAVRDRRGLAVVLGVVAAAVCSVAIVLLLADRAAADAHDRGEIFDFGITVPETPLTVGDSLTFVNTGARPHTATDRGGMLGTGAVRPGESGALTFDIPGTYELFCEINPSTMNATVVVLPAEDPPAQVRVQAFDEARDGAAKSFDDPTPEVRPGTEVVLANVGGLPHTLTARDGSFTTDVVEPGPEEGRFAGGNGSFVAPGPGTYEFFCEIHPQAMQGVLVVSPLEAVADAADQPGPPIADEPDDDGEVAAGPEDDGGSRGLAMAGAGVLLLLGLVAIAIAVFARRPATDGDIS